MTIENTFLAIFDPLSSIAGSVFDCRLSDVSKNSRATRPVYMWHLNTYEPRHVVYNNVAF